MRYSIGRWRNRGTGTLCEWPLFPLLSPLKTKLLRVRKRMKTLIDMARKEMTIFILFSEVLKGPKDSLISAKERRRVRLNIVMIQNVFEKEDSWNLGEIRLLGCSVDSLGMLISDMKTLLTVSNWMKGAALFTQDQNLIRIAKDYFDSPSCCTPVDTSKKSWR